MTLPKPPRATCGRCGKEWLVCYGSCSDNMTGSTAMTSSSTALSTKKAQNNCSPGESLRDFYLGQTTRYLLNEAINFGEKITHSQSHLRIVLAILSERQVEIRQMAEDRREREATNG